MDNDQWWLGLIFDHKNNVIKFGPMDEDREKCLRRTLQEAGPGLREWAKVFDISDPKSAHANLVEWFALCGLNHHAADAVFDHLANALGRMQ